MTPTTATILLTALVFGALCEDWDTRRSLHKLRQLKSTKPSAAELHRAVTRASARHVPPIIAGVVGTTVFVLWPQSVSSATEAVSLIEPVLAAISGFGFGMLLSLVLRNFVARRSSNTPKEN